MNTDQLNTLFTPEVYATALTQFICGVFAALNDVESISSEHLDSFAEKWQAQLLEVVAGDTNQTKFSYTMQPKVTFEVAFFKKRLRQNAFFLEIDLKHPDLPKYVMEGFNDFYADRSYREIFDECEREHEGEDVLSAFLGVYLVRESRITHPGRVLILELDSYHAAVRHLNTLFRTWNAEEGSL